MSLFLFTFTVCNKHSNSIFITRLFMKAKSQSCKYIITLIVNFGQVELLEGAWQVKDWNSNLIFFEVAWDHYRAPTFGIVANT